MDYVIFDLDGTLAVIDHRLHLLPDWGAFFNACDKDEPNWPVIHTYQAIKSAGRHDVQVWSGRSDAVRDKTEAWLERYLGHLPPLKMRKRYDNIADNALKERWLDEIGVATVSCVFDDRDKVVAMWRRRGVACFQVAPGNF